MPLRIWAVLAHHDHYISWPPSECDVPDDQPSGASMSHSRLAQYCLILSWDSMYILVVSFGGRRSGA